MLPTSAAPARAKAAIISERTTDLQRRLDKAAVDASWPDLMGDLAQVQAVTLDLDGRRNRLRTDLRGAAGKAFAAAGVRLPSPIEDRGPATA